MFRYLIKIKNGKKEIIYCGCNKEFYAYQILKMIQQDNKKDNLSSDNVYIYDNKLKTEIKYF